MKLLFMILISFSYAALAIDEVEVIKQCSAASLRYGDGKSKQGIPEICFTLYKSKSSSNARKLHLKSGKEVIGYRDMIFMEDDKISVITGKNTLLKEIVALDIDEKNNSLVVLDKNGDVLTFNLNISGNVSPLRVLRSKQASGASNVVVDEEKEQIIILHSITKKAYSFDRLGNIFARPEKRFLGLKKETSGVEMFNVKKQNGEVELLDVNGIKLN